MTCFVCGKPINQKNNVVMGRPKNYCSDYCRDFQKYFNAMQKALDNIDLDNKHKRKIKGNLFRVANTITLPYSKTFGTNILAVEN